jgi:hypothetical protein
MYNGVLAVIVGEAWLFGSVSLIEYALLVLVLFHLFVVLYEEPALTSQVGPHTESHSLSDQQLPQHRCASSHPVNDGLDRGFRRYDTDLTQCGQQVAADEHQRR